jgi:hypothetical protein
VVARLSASKSGEFGIAAIADLGSPQLVGKLPKTRAEWSKALKTWLWEEPALGVRNSEVGWNDGGCFDLAEALVTWLTPERADRLAIIGPHGIEHVVAKVGEWYLDGDGATELKPLLRRWEKLEGVENPQLLAVTGEEIRARGIPLDSEVSQKLAALLGECFSAQELLNSAERAAREL